jgi:hypothetical protein
MRGAWPGQRVAAVLRSPRRPNRDLAIGTHVEAVRFTDYLTIDSIEPRLAPAEAPSVMLNGIAINVIIEYQITL